MLQIIMIILISEQLRYLFWKTVVGGTTLRSVLLNLEEESKIGKKQKRIKGENVNDDVALRYYICKS